MGYHAQLPLGGVIEVAHYVDELLIEAHGQDHRKSGPKPHPLDMVQLRHPREKAADAIVEKQRGVPSGDEHFRYQGMLLEPGQGLIQLGNGCKGVRADRLIDLPVTLAVDADLGAAVVGLQNRYHRVTSGHQVDGRCVAFPHEVQRCRPPHPENTVDIAQRGDDLSPDGMIVSTMRFPVHEG